MFEKRFAKYARAVSDNSERRQLYKKYKIRTTALFVFIALCFAVIILSLALEPYINEGWALAVMAFVLFAWLVAAAAALCLWISFKRTFNAILKRPPFTGELPEVTAYRQKTLKAKRDEVKKIWWAWLIFWAGVAAFLVGMVMEVSVNGESDELGAWGAVAVLALAVGVLVIAFAKIACNSAAKNNKNFPEEIAIDRAQGREPEYRPRDDGGVADYRYMFPDAVLYGKAEAARKKYSKYISGGIIVMLFLFIAVFAGMLILDDFGICVVGYAFPSALTVAFAVMLLCIALPGQSRELNRLEKKQKAELESVPEYAKNLEWYNLLNDFNKSKGRLVGFFFLAGLALGWVLGVVFPEKLWSLTAVIPIIAGLAVNNKLVKNLRSKTEPIEREIDKAMLVPREVRFYISGGSADNGTGVCFDGDDLAPLVPYGRGEIVLSFAETHGCLEVERETGRVINFSSSLYLDEDERGDVPAPINVSEARLFAVLDGALKYGSWFRIAFAGGEVYDEANGRYLIGKFDGGLPCYKIFSNVYVQLSPENELLAVLCTDITK